MSKVVEDKNKWIWWTIGIGLPLGLGAFVFWAYNVVTKISVDTPSIANLTIQTIIDAVSALKQGTGSVITFDLSIPIKNESGSDVSFSNFYGELYHEGQLIAKSNDNPANFEKKTIKANDTTNIIYTLDLIVSPQLLDTLVVLAGQEIELEYKAKVKVDGALGLYGLKDEYSHQDTFKFKF